MKLLDLFCKAGGCTKGYQQAGFYVVGVDIEPQPHYCGDEFIQADVLSLDLDFMRTFDAIHASPPCQKHSTMRKGRWQDREHPDLIPPTRDLLRLTGKPYIIENVEGAKKELINPFMLCGTMFGLQTKHGSQLRRHRLFETNFQIGLTPPCNHNNTSAIGVYGGGQHPLRRKVPSTIGVYGHAGGSSRRDGPSFGTQDRRDAMGIDWMTGNELSQAIPPAYTKFIGERLRAIMEVDYDPSNNAL